MPRRYRTPYDQDDDLDITRHHRAPTQAGLVSAVSALVTLALLSLIAILGVLIGQVQTPEDSGLLLVGIIFLDLAAFVSSIVGLVQGFRSQGAEQVHHRGYGLAGLIGSILCLIATLAVGVTAMCAGMLITFVRNVPGG